MESKDPTEAWKVFIIGVLILGSIACVSLWYDKNYCDDVVIPVRCSK